MNIIKIGNWKMCASKWGGRKRAALALSREGSNSWFVIASFNSDESKEAFEAFLDNSLDAYVESKKEKRNERRSAG